MTARWLTVATAADYSGYGIDTIWEALRAGALRGYRRHERGRWRIAVEDVDAWIRGEDPADREVPALTRTGT
jgi:excisionase family DNA binding protein